MTAEEFNKKYEDYIEPRFEDQGLMIDSPKAIEFLDEVFGQILIHVPGFTYSQIKMKFGMSRIYMNKIPSSLSYWMEGVVDKMYTDGV